MPIDPGIYGQNAWEVSANNINQLDPYYSDVAFSGVKFMRIGGISVNFNPLYTRSGTTITGATGLITLINKCLDNGIEPVVQVSYEPQTMCTPDIGTQGGETEDDQAAIAGILVSFINTYYNNNPHPSWPGFFVRYWIIANEPDHSVDCSTGKSGYGKNGSGLNNSLGYVADATFISTYIKKFATAMKSADPRILTIGPETNQFSTDPNSPHTQMYQQLISSVGANNPDNSIMGTIGGSGPAAGKFYIDIVSFHSYPILQSRPAVIANPASTSGIGAKCSTTVFNKIGIAQMITGVTNPVRNSANCKIACTEVNLTAQLDHGNESTSYSLTSIGGYSGRSYLAGQWMAETMSYMIEAHPWVKFFMPWSIAEGGCSAGANEDTFGYISNCGSNGQQGKKRSSYWHYQMMAKYIRGTFYRGSVTNNTNSGNVKVFSGSGCTGVGIMIMNQNQSSITVDIDFYNTPNGGSNYNITLNNPSLAGWPDLNNFTIDAEETVVLVYDACKTLKTIYRYDKNNNLASAASGNDDPDVTSYSGPRSCMCVKKANYTYDFPNTNLRCAVSTETGTAHYNTYTLTGNLKIQDSAFVTGVLTVPNGKHLTIDSAEVVFGSGASINVQTGGTLTISNSNLHGCTDSSWTGITVNANNTKAVTITASRIAGAWEAVKAINVDEVVIDGNIIENNRTGIILGGVRGFTLTNNEFLGNPLALHTLTCQGIASLISENLFYESDTCILFKGDDHSRLDIKCNAFINYLNHGIASMYTNLKTQGSGSSGTGNIFVSNSGQTNHQISFTGTTTASYYLDPSYSFTLQQTSPYMLTLYSARSNGACTESSNSRKSNLIQEAQEYFSSKSMLLNCAPNPASNEVTFNYMLEENCIKSNIVIRNILGTSIKTVQLAKDSKSMDVNLSEYQSGIYFYSLYVNDKLIETKKLILSQ